jgi:hypothetical protein
MKLLPWRFYDFNHDEMPAIYILFMPAFTPCGDGFSPAGRAQTGDARSPAGERGVGGKISFEGGSPLV